MAQHTTPEQRVAAAVARWGSRGTVRRCCATLAGEADAELATMLGGASAPGVLNGREGGLHGRWPRTWAVRAFLYVWAPEAEEALLGAHTDAEWRVREMVAKVIAARGLSTPQSGEALLALADDEHPRVRAAAERALG